MSIEESPNELFNRLLSDTDKSPEDFLFSFGAAMKMPASSSSSDLAGLKVHVNIEGVAQSREITGSSEQACRKADFRVAIKKVMNSGIFYKGGLQGRPLSRNNLDYMVYFFRDLALFILMATSYLINEEMDKRFRDLILENFDSAIKKIDKLKSIAAFCNSKVNYNNLGNIKNDLEDIKSNLLAKPYIALPAPLRKTGDRVDLLIRLFREQLPPDTPDIVIAKAILTLLHAFNIFIIEVDGIRARITRAKQK